MRNIFNFDGPLFVFLSKMADLALLNLLFILCSLPIFTIGASMTAMCYVTLRMQEGHDGYVFKSFFKSFKENFIQATLIWLIMLVIAVFLAIDFYIARGIGGIMYTVMSVFVLAAAVVWLLEFFHVFTVLARFENKLGATMKNGLLVAFGNAPRAFLMLLVFVLAVIGTFFNATTLGWGLLVWLLMGFALINYIHAGLQLKIIHRLMPEEETGSNPDEWSVPED